MKSPISNSPLVSVVVSLFNKEKYIAATIESVLSQTYHPVELIIIDDGSTDNSVAIAQKYLDAKVFSQKNQGAYAARNYGASIATGDFFAFLDADDIWYEQKLEKQMAVFSSFPKLSVVTTLSRKIDQKGEELPSERKIPIPIDEPFYPIKILLEIGNPFCLSSGLVRRASFEAVHGFRKILLSEDYDFWIRIAAEEQLFYVVPEILTGYRVLKTSKLHGSLQKEYGALLNILALHKHRYSSIQHIRRKSRIFCEWADSANWSRDCSVWYAISRAMMCNPLSPRNYSLLLKIIYRTIV